uniref:Shootin-1 n=1 Tax=Esox lucius TaxID=8010 RepID=A0A3P8XIE4_ESOLU
MNYQTGKWENVCTHCSSLFIEDLISSSSHSPTYSLSLSVLLPNTPLSVILLLIVSLSSVTSQLLKEMDVLEIQFQIERSCRESAEALAVRVTKENKVLKRKSQALMPFIPELPEDIETMACETVDLGVDPGPDEDSEVVLQGQEQIRDLQASIDQLLGEKLQLCEEVEALKREQSLLKEQLILEIAEKENVLKKLTRQNKTLNKMKRVSHLVTEEFTEINQKLELEQDLRQHAEVFAHQVLVKQTETQRQSLVLQHSSETNLQLQQALEQVAQIKSTLQDIQLYYQNQKCFTALILTLLALKQLQDRLKDLEKDSVSEAGQPGEDNSTSAPPTPPLPPPPPPPPPATTSLQSLQLVHCCVSISPPEPDPTVDIKFQAVNEMMERIKKGIVLRPMQRSQVGLDQSIHKPDTMKHTGHRRAASRKRISRKVGEEELLLVLQRRRRAIGDGIDTTSSCPSTTSTNIQGESGGSPVLRRLQHNREKRNSRIRASALLICQEQI